MFGIGYQEMFVILVVALVVFGPARLPELAGQVGRWVRDFRRMSSDLTGEFEKTFAEVEEVKKSFQREIQSIQDEVEGVGKSTRGDLKKLSGKSPSAAKKSTATSSQNRRHRHPLRRPAAGRRRELPRPARRRPRMVTALRRFSFYRPPEKIPSPTSPSSILTRTSPSLPTVKRRSPTERRPKQSKRSAGCANDGRAQPMPRRRRPEDVDFDDDFNPPHYRSSRL